ncbi:NAD-dependent epimerase/dehydratase family protein [Tamlana sp. 2201CG12-4]|uniref:NAD-dependent epimerase/dehydratase family protein n=1 Tax=Tamlana sp. 2201CG12-4 TaxID=3112582 RepID=UPI002DBF0DBB|nr:NAD-dependent epimerase/dehydratase family protein [Tamlana sp. 2201CG12-4]MEC3908848.1 NAD-dependent epimerase/dehydratase family protein [Tamlana sp. 2201CG12-4]
MKEKILVTGASGQLGAVLTKRLQDKFGVENVIATDLNNIKTYNGCFEVLDATDYDRVQFLVKTYAITQIYHMAAILSANGEKNPFQTWEVNMKTLFNILEVSRHNNITKVFFPSSIAVYGSDFPKVNTPQTFSTSPQTVYGVSKVAGENWANYYCHKYGLDIRSIRYPGVIGHQSLPGGGTTDYAVEMYHKAVKNEVFECFLNHDAVLPMIYMEDAINATIDIMEAPFRDIRVRTSYNISGLSFSPSQLAESIQSIFPEFKIRYNPDFRQRIADSWPESVDDSEAREDWKWQPKYDINTMTKDMVMHLRLRYFNETQNI